MDMVKRDDTVPDTQNSDSQAKMERLKAEYNARLDEDAQAKVAAKAAKPSKVPGKARTSTLDTIPGLSESQRKKLASMKAKSGSRSPVRYRRSSKQ
jgi:hypothetical protein